MSEWKDISSYSRGEKHRTPNAFELRTPWITLRVSRHIHYPGKWVYRINHLMNDPCPLEAETIEVAKATAVNILIDQLEESLDCLRKV